MYRELSPIIIISSIIINTTNEDLLKVQIISIHYSYIITRISEVLHKLCTSSNIKQYTE